MCAHRPGGGPADRLGRLAGYLIDQQSFYPLYPAEESVGLDFQHWQRHCQLPVLPHVLVTPSDFKGFVKVSAALTKDRAFSVKFTARVLNVSERVRGSSVNIKELASVYSLTVEPQLFPLECPKTPVKLNSSVICVFIL